MIEKLLEDWLDSTNERSYQACFVQMLSAKNYQVLHSTRHCALEYGKDVIAVAPDGVPCAFQLKGQPGGRLGLHEFRSDIQQQLVQLISQPIAFPGLSTDTPHRSFLVTNGYVEEEVTRAIDDLNRGPYMSKIEIIPRGTLLAWAKELGTDLWPNEVECYRDLLEVFLHDGRDLLPIDRLAAIFETILSLREDGGLQSRTQLSRSVTSAGLVAGIATHKFAQLGNHYAVASAWALFTVSVISTFERHHYELDTTVKRSLDLAEAAIRDSLVALWNDVSSRSHLVEGNAQADPELYRWRYTLLSALCSVLWFFPRLSDEDRERTDDVATWIKKREPYFELWGEAAVVHMIVYWLCLRRVDPTIRPDRELASLLHTVVERCQRKTPMKLPDPYYEFETVARNRLGLLDTESVRQMRDETFAGCSYSAELLLHLVTKARLKVQCREAWADFSRLSHFQFVPREPWQYGLLRSPKGRAEARMYPHEYSWSQLCEDAGQVDCEHLPAELGNRPHILLLWVVIAPHRLTSSLGRYLAAKLPDE